MKDLYETEYGIYNHLRSDKNRPLASVAFHNSEDMTTDNLLRDTINVYVDKNIHDFFHISLIDFLELPLDIIQLLISIASEKKSKKINAIDEIEKEFNKK
jgi:hypothetical protein